jgi:hypothetical protein
MICLENNKWTQRNSSSALSSQISTTYGAPAIYRPSTRFIHVFTHRAIQSYHVPSDLWYFDSIDYNLSPLDSRVFGTATLFDENHVVLFGGQLNPMQMSGTIRTCFFNTLIIFDLDCWSVDNVTVLAGKARRGHTAIKQNDNLVIAGGHNGIDKSDLIVAPINLPLRSPELRERCRSDTWCEKSNWCDDCVMKEGCGWCDGRCRYGCTSKHCPSGT